MNDAALLVGQVLGGRYRLTGILGQGGVGTVYDAIQEDLGRKVAVKVLHVELARDPAWARRMEREARATAVLDHPNIVQLSDFQLTAGGLPFLVMERLTGTSLRGLLEKEGTLPAARVVAIAMQVLAALDVAHRAGIVHRDIKPENVFLVSTPAAADFVKVLDFGIAKAIEVADGASGALSMTRTGAILGTAGYMPPEQARGEPIDARADIYSVGACMYEALAGRAPNADADALGQHRSDLDPALVATIARALAPDATDRFATAQSMIDALRAPPSSSAALAPTDPLAVPLPRTPRTIAPPSVPTRAAPTRSPALLIAVIGVFALLVVSVVALAGIGIWFVKRDARATHEPEPTTTTPAPTASTSIPPTPLPPASSAARGRLPRRADVVPPSPTPPPHPPATVDAGAPRDPWQNPPPLAWSDVTFEGIVETQATASTRASVESFVSRVVAPINRECYRANGFQFQAGKDVDAHVQFMIFNDGHIESFVMLADGGGIRAADCVEAKLRATSAKGVCDLTAPPACTVRVDLKARYR